MKKISLVVALLALTATVSFSAVKPKKSKLNFAKKFFGRECCTRTGTMGDNGATISITVCSGWFLSNSETAHARACEKADEAIAAVR
jgi:hypothetical protein